MKNFPSIRFTKGAALAVAVAAVLVPAAQANYLYVGGFSLGAGATFNMSASGDTVLSAASNGLIVQAPNGGTQTTNITNVYNALTSGFNAGDWLGTGITSPTVAADAQINGVLSVMLYDNNQLGYDKWAGLSGLTTDPNLNQVMTRITYAGDLDGSGTITVSDYGLLDFYLASALTAQGDLNGDGVINVGDYGLLDYVLATQVYGNLGDATAFAGAGKSPSAGVVPEPTSAMLLLSGAAGLLGLRKRKQSN